MAGLGSGLMNAGMQGINRMINPIQPTTQAATGASLGGGLQPSGMLTGGSFVPGMPVDYRLSTVPGASFGGLR